MQQLIHNWRIKQWISPNFRRISRVSQFPIFFAFLFECFGVIKSRACICCKVKRLTLLLAESSSKLFWRFLEILSNLNNYTKQDDITRNIRFVLARISNFLSRFRISKQLHGQAWWSGVPFLLVYDVFPYPVPCFIFLFLCSWKGTPPKDSFLSPTVEPEWNL